MLVKSVALQPRGIGIAWATLFSYVDAIFPVEKPCVDSIFPVDIEIFTRRSVKTFSVSFSISKLECLSCLPAPGVPQVPELPFGAWHPVIACAAFGRLALRERRASLLSSVSSGETGS